MSSAGEELGERVLHPAFYGSYDWHSAVHMHWLLLRVLRLYPVSQMAPRIADALDAHLTADAVARELDYFNGSAGRTFERPHGWAWMLDLLAEALLMSQLLEQEELQRWLQAFAPQGFGALAKPPSISDHADPKQSHLDGLCLTRAWCFARLGDSDAAQKLVAATLPHVVEGDYAGTHWLASFVALALGERP